MMRRTSVASRAPSSVVAAEAHVLGDGEVEDDTAGEAIFGHVGDATALARAHAQARDVVAVDEDAADARGRDAGDGQRQLRWPLPSTPATPRISPPRTDRLTSSSARRAVVARDREPLDAQPLARGRLGAALRPRRRRRPRSRPTIARASSAAVEARGSREATTSPRRSTVTRVASASTSSSLWVTSTTVLPSSTRPRSTSNSSPTSSGVKHRGRLVEDEHVGAAPQHLDDLDPLRLAHRQRRDQPARLDAEAEALRQLGDLALGPARVDERPLFRLAPEHHVLGHGQGRHQHEVLVHHAHLARDRRRHRRAGDDLAADAHLAGVGRFHAVERAHQRRLAGAVLADDARAPRRASPTARRRDWRRTAPKRLYTCEQPIASAGRRARHRAHRLGTSILPAMMSRRSASTRACTASPMSARLCSS